MNASRVTISLETRAKMNNPALSPAKKRSLREQLIIESISANPMRTKQELVAAAGLECLPGTKGYANGLNLIASMMKRGLIDNDGGPAYRKLWQVSAIKANPTPKQMALSVVLAPTYSKEKIVEMARVFAWDTNSDSLRDFIKSLK